MKKIVSYLVSHFKSEFRPLFLVLYLLMLFGFVAYRYQFDFDYNFWYKPLRYFYGFLFYFIPILVVSCLYSFTHKKDYLKNYRFWVLVFWISITLFGAHYLTYYPVLLEASPLELRDFLRQVFYNTHASIWYLVPAFLFWRLIDKENRSSFYGLTHRNFDWKTYALMLLIVAPFVAWASFRPDFLQMYPRYKPGTAETYLSWSYGSTFSVHLSFYLLQFLALEVCFRGFFVLTLNKFMGEGSVWVMVFVYVLIHFGKPWPETVSSAFGGYILGVLSLKTRSVMGGVYIHAGVAMMMEFFAYGQLSIFASHQ
jgi:hypothetical protein